MHKESKCDNMFMTSESRERICGYSICYSFNLSAGLKIFNIKSCWEKYILHSIGHLLQGANLVNILLPFSV